MAQHNESLFSESGVASSGFLSKIDDTEPYADSQVVFDMDLPSPDRDTENTSINQTAPADNDDELASIVDSGFLQSTPALRRHTIIEASLLNRSDTTHSQSTGLGVIHRSPSFHPAVNAVQRVTETRLNHLNFGRFLREAADEFTTTTLTETRTRRYSIAVMPSVSRYRAESCSSANSEPFQSSSSLPGSCIKFGPNKSPPHAPQASRPNALEQGSVLGNDD